MFYQYEKEKKEAEKEETRGRIDERKKNIYFSLRAATPGSTLPSRSSRDAPPPKRQEENRLKIRVKIKRKIKS